MKTKKFLLYTFVALFLIGSANSWNIFNLHPASIHQWRQSDCASYVKTFFRNHTNVFTPGTFNLAGKEGRVASEFPIIYYVAAKIQIITGEHYWVIRGLTFLCFILGLIALFECCKKWIPKKFYAAFPVLILATTPYYYYYALNFLPNVPAISFSFIGLFFLLKYEENNKRASLIFGILSFTLATLLKPTDGGILFAAYLLVKSLSYVPGFKKSIITKHKRQFLFLLLGALFIAIVNITWIKYVNWYNDLNGNHQNLIGIYPIWDMDNGMRNYTIERIIKEWSNVYQQKLLFVLMGVALLIYILKWRLLNPFLKIFTLFIFFGIVGYSILWFKAYTDHDYYQLPLVLFPVFLFITVLEYYSKSLLPKLNFWTSKGVLSVLIIAIGISFYHNHNIQKERFLRSVDVINPKLFEIEPYLLKLGIDPQDHVVCVPDKSPNASLNAINRFGYTEEFNYDDYNINYFQKHGAKYLIISNNDYLDNPLYIPFEKKKIGEFEGISVFDIR